MSIPEVIKTQVQYACLPERLSESMDHRARVKWPAVGVGKDEVVALLSESRPPPSFRPEKCFEKLSAGEFIVRQTAYMASDTVR